MGSEGQFDPSHFAVFLLEALKDPQIQSALNKSIDHSKINNMCPLRLASISRFLKRE